MNAAPCSACGRELPRISPEVLFFRATTPGGPALPRVAAFLPPDLRAVAFGGQIYAMTGADWAHFERLRASWRALPGDAAAAA